MSEYYQPSTSEVNPRRMELLEQRFFSSKQNSMLSAASRGNQANSNSSNASSLGQPGVQQHQPQTLSQHQQHQQQQQQQQQPQPPPPTQLHPHPQQLSTHHNQHQSLQTHHHLLSANSPVVVAHQQQNVPQDHLVGSLGHPASMVTNQASTHHPNNHRLLYLERAVQTDLDMDKLKDQDTKSAAKDSRLEEMQQSKDDLDREMKNHQKIITKQQEQLTKCLDVTKQLLIDKSQIEKKAARQRCMQNRLRLGQFTTQRHGASFVENWVDGYAFAEILKKQEAVTHEKEEIDKQRKLLSKRRPSTSSSKPKIPNSASSSNSPSSSMTDSGISSNTGSSILFPGSSSVTNNTNSDHKNSSLSNGSEFIKPEIPKDRHRELDYYEQEEILKLRHVALRKEDAELQLEFEKLERERNLHIRELKRIHNEDQSRFNNHQILNEKYLLLTLLGKGGFCKYN